MSTPEGREASVRHKQAATWVVKPQVIQNTRKSNTKQEKFMK
jgi:hypothetical protein